MTAESCIGSTAAKTDQPKNVQNIVIRSILQDPCTTTIFAQVTLKSNHLRYLQVPGIDHNTLIGQLQSFPNDTWT